MLFAREPNEAGYYASEVYLGQMFDEDKYRVIPRGWEHEHCFLCWAKVLPGDKWWGQRGPALAAILDYVPIATAG
jgi:hypothetical protein